MLALASFALGLTLSAAPPPPPAPSGAQSSAQSQSQASASASAERSESVSMSDDGSGEVEAETEAEPAETDALEPAAGEAEPEPAAPAATVATVEGPRADTTNAEPAAAPPSPGPTGFDRERWAAERHALNFDERSILRNQWPVAPICNMGGAPDVCLTIDAEVFTGYRMRSIAGERFGEFALDRTELGTNLWYRPHDRVDAGATVRFEAIRSAGPQSLIGIDGDSLVIRLAQAYGHTGVHLGPIHLGVRGGLIPERWIEQLEKGYDTLGVARLASENNLLFERADLGASITASGWGGLVDVDLQLTNGEGRAQEELNRGKNTTAILTVRPLRMAHAKGPITLALHGAYRDGSWGVAAARAHRGAAGLTFASPWGFAGMEFVQAFGVREQGDRTTRSVGGWVSAYAWQPYVGLLAKYDHIRQDLALQDSAVDVITAGVFSDIFGYAWRRRRRVRLYATYQHEGYGALAGPIPGAPQAADTHRFLLQLEAQGLLRAL
jgi:hypothetical protein